MREMTNVNRCAADATRLKSDCDAYENESNMNKSVENVMNNEPFVGYDRDRYESMCGMHPM